MARLAVACTAAWGALRKDSTHNSKRVNNFCPTNIFAGPRPWSMTSPCQGLLWPVLLCEGLLALRALAWVRTPDEKGLRGRNSPMCTLSQNGYGDTLWFTKVLPTLVRCPDLAPGRRDGIPPSHFPKEPARHAFLWIVKWISLIHMPWGMLVLKT